MTQFFLRFYPTRNLKVAFYPTQNPNASQWNIGCVGCQRNIFASSMYISCFLCRFHLRRAPNANPFFGEYGLKPIFHQRANPFMFERRVGIDPQSELIPTLLKPIFHRKLGLRWLQNAKEINTKKMKCTCPTPAPTPEAQRHLYSTDWRRGLASGLTQILGLASGVWRRVTQKNGIS